MKKKLIRFTKGILLLAALPILYIVGVLTFAYFTDYQPEKIETLVIQGKGEPLEDTTTLQVLTWNIGYCGLGKESDFFYDGGKTVHSKKEWVEKNLKGVVSVLNSLKDSLDFALLQEADNYSARSWDSSQIGTVARLFPQYATTFGKNYDVKFVPVPYTEPMGHVQSGIFTLSRLKPTKAQRHQLNAYFNFPDYLFYLDRCFTTHTIPLKNGKQLTLINTHNSAYDPKGEMKKIELEQIKTVLLEAAKNGNYVIMGGDWNQYPPNFKGIKGFAPKHNHPANWVTENYPEAGWKWAYQTEVPTNRANLTPFHPDSSYQTVIDYFLVSPNVEVSYTKGIDLGFDYSDHQPVLMKVKLN